MLQSPRIGMPPDQHQQHQQETSKRGEEDDRWSLPKTHRATNGEEHLDVSTAGRVKDERQEQEKSADEASPDSCHKGGCAAVSESPRESEQRAPNR